MNISFRILILIVIVGFVNACKSKKNPEKSIIKDSEAVAFATSEERDRKVIFYSMLLPTEMSRIFEKVGANYDPSIINPTDQFSSYDNPHSIAVNIGIYGVDMSYARLFDQSAETAKYFTTIQMMTERLGIPEDLYDDLLKKIEENISQKDSLITYTTEMYERIDHFLKEKNNNGYAALIVMGGWIEALYIASEIFDKNPDNIEIMDRIAEQKYSLNSLISLLSNYQEDIKVAEYLLMLKRLREAYDKFEIYYERSGLELDTIEKQITAEGYDSGVTTDIIMEIGNLIAEIRMGFIEPRVERDIVIP